MVTNKKTQPAILDLCAFTELEESLIFQQTLHIELKEHLKKAAVNYFLSRPK